jgi:HlyD family secretion protein
VKIKLSPYPFQKYGMLEGEVVHVGPDAAEGDGQQANKDPAKEKPVSQMAYKALVSLGTQVLEAQHERHKLMPGMQVVAEIDQGQRTVMEYLLSPVQKTLYDSGRER